MRNQLDEILARMVKEQVLTLEESIAIGESVRFVHKNLNENSKNVFIRKYGNDSLKVINRLLS